MILTQITDLLAERVGRQFDKPFKRELEDMVIYHRARYITNSLSKRPANKKYYMQSFLAKLEKVSKEECSSLGCPCEDLSRTTEEIPDVLKISPHPFDYIGGEGGAKAYGWTTFGIESYYAENPITSKFPRYTFLNNRIYIFNEKNIENVRVEGVFADPRLLAKFKCPGENKPCYSESSPFPIDLATLQIVIEAILSKELRIIPIKEEIEVKADKSV